MALTISCECADCLTKIATSCFKSIKENVTTSDSVSWIHYRVSVKIMPIMFFFYFFYLFLQLTKSVKRIYLNWMALAEYMAFDTGQKWITTQLWLKTKVSNFKKKRSFKHWPRRHPAVIVMNASEGIYRYTISRKAKKETKQQPHNNQNPIFNFCFPAWLFPFRRWYS